MLLDRVHRKHSGFVRSHLTFLSRQRSHVVLRSILPDGIFVLECFPAVGMITSSHVRHRDERRGWSAVRPENFDSDQVIMHLHR